MAKDFNMGVSYVYTITDLEHLFILLVLILSFVLGLRRRPRPNPHTTGFSLDLSFSVALKGIGAVLILMGHYGQMEINRSSVASHSIDSIVAVTLANIALVWFMFISGYGLTVSRHAINNHLLGLCKRVGKVFYPMLFVFAVSLVVYYMVDYPQPHTIAKNLAIPDEIRLMPSNIFGNMGFIASGIIRWYWYPWCAIMMYICFYMADYISVKLNVSGGGKSWILLLILAIYYIGAFVLLGPSLAHYYRLVWAFFMGHIFARWHSIPQKQIIVMCVMALSTFCFEQTVMILSFCVAILIVVACSMLNCYFEYHGKLLLKLGGLSYFYYLCHRRIVWPIICSFDCYDVLLWAIASFFVSWVLKSCYDMLKAYIKVK